MKNLKWNRFCTIFVMLMFITVTYASFNTNLFINGKGYVRVNADIRITDIKVLSTENGAYESVDPEYTKDSVTMDLNLPHQESTITYQVTIQNKSDYDYDVQNIIEEQYTNKNISYEITGLTVNDTILEAKTTKKFTIKLNNNTTITEEEDKYETSTYIFDYTGGEQEFIVPYDGEYTLEVWGAQGGGNTTYANKRGYGGYSKGTINLTKNKKIYINVGGQGLEACDQTYGHRKLLKGGYNGGGDACSWVDAKCVGSGGGATSISYQKGLLNTQEKYKNWVIIVAGGGGGLGKMGGEVSGTAGSGGGYIGGTGTSTSNIWHGTGGTQTKGGNNTGEEFATRSGFGQGTSAKAGGGNISGGGGGYYGGGAGCGAGGYGGGGSGYIGNASLTNKVMYCFNCNESSEESTKTITTENHSAAPTSNYAKEGNGYAKITFTRKVEDGTDFDFDYTGGEQTFTAPYTGIYKLETWGAQGGKVIINNQLEIGGYGGYSTGKSKIQKDTTLYINVGQEGHIGDLDFATGSDINYGTRSYNGGGGYSSNHNCKWAGGGGATHIALVSGTLNNLSSYKGELIENKYYQSQKILLVGAGGGGAGGCSFNLRRGGDAGGYIGNNGSNYNSYTNTIIEDSNAHCNDGGAGGTQISNGINNHDRKAIASFGYGGFSKGSGGGGGFFGGNGSWNCGSPAGGGSSYIASSLLTDKVMYCYNCEESKEENIKTVTTQAHSKMPKQNQSKEENGYARITLLQRQKNQVQLKLKLDFQKLKEYQINYNLDGGTLENPIETYTRNDNDFTLPTPTKEGYRFVGWTGGKNLFWSYDQTYTSKGITSTRNDDGSISFKGTTETTWTNITTTYNHLLTPGTYTISIPEVMPHSTCLKGRDVTDVIREFSIFTGETSKTFTITENLPYYFYIGQLTPNTYYENTSYVQVEEGDTPTAYEAYIFTPNNNISISKGSRGNRTYTAVWEQFQYDINYDLDGGTLSKKRNSYTTFDDNIALGVPNKEGYTFTGWTGGKNLFDKNHPKESNVFLSEDGKRAGITTRDRSFYLKIDSNTDYTITYPENISRFRAFTYPRLLEGEETVEDVNGINADGKNKIVIRSGVEDKYLYINLPIECIFSDYYDGLMVEKGTDNTSYEEYLSTPTKNITISKGSTGNRTYKANWVKNYTTTFDGNGGSSYSVTVLEGGTSTFYPISTKPDNLFTGWYTAATDGTLLRQGGFNYHQDRTVYAHWEPPKPYEEGTALATIESGGYSSFTYDPTTKEYTVTQNRAGATEWFQGMLNFNYFGPIPYNYRYIVCMEIWTPESYSILEDYNNVCTGCDTNDNWDKKYVNINDDTANQPLKANEWNQYYLTYENTRASTNIENNPVKDYTGFRLITDNEITYKIRNIQYTYVPI